MPDSYDDFIKLRAAIVRAVGTTWNNEHFKHHFIESPLSAMKTQFGYDCPLDVTLKVKRSNATNNPDHFDPMHTGGWVGTNNTLRLYLPPVPKDPKQKPEALAAFNQDRPLFLFPKK